MVPSQMPSRVDVIGVCAAVWIEPDQRRSKAAGSVCARVRVESATDRTASVVSLNFVEVR